MRRTSVSVPLGYAERQPAVWYKFVLYPLIAIWLLWFFLGDTIQATLRERQRHRPSIPAVRVWIPENRPFRRYEIVPVRVALRASDGKPIRGISPRVRVFRGEEPLRDAANRRYAPLRYDRDNDVWVARYAMPIGSRPGTYTFEVSAALPADRVRLTEEEARGIDSTANLAARKVGRTASVSFEVQGRDPAEVPPALCIATVEAARDIRSMGFWTPDGRPADWHAVMEWVDLLGADTLWVQGPTTDTRTAPLSRGSPWAGANLAALDDLIRECRQRGIRLGVWIPSMRLFGEPSTLPPYRIGGVAARVPAVAVSFLDTQRPKDLADAVKWLCSIQGVDYVGLDYLRDEPQSWDAVDRFIEDLGLDVPKTADGQEMDAQARQAWLRHSWMRWRQDRSVFDMWNWWRAHRMAEIVADIRARAKPDKPLWGFTLGWKHGLEHGQDPFMLMDAGIDLDAVMLYQIEGRDRYEAMMREWSQYTRPEEVGGPEDSASGLELTPPDEAPDEGPEVIPVPIQLVVGDQVDDYHHQRTRETPTPLELYTRIHEAVRQCATNPRVRGVFIHDIIRLASGRGDTGPYPAAEWAIAGAAAGSDVRAVWGRVPFRLSVEAPARVALDQPFDVIVRATHTGDAPPAEGLLVRPLATEAVTVSQEAIRLGDLNPGGTAQCTFSAVVHERNPERANRFMLAFRGQTTTEGVWPHATAFAYVWVP
ncbi:MAG TPA: hypothetical protein PLD23_02310 [Armatimonadota bacterium]|nr:hypothetical protein [Armatimonadota bacterium]